jgi:hypothetical protein
MRSRQALDVARLTPRFRAQTARLVRLLRREIRVPTLFQPFVSFGIFARSIVLNHEMTPPEKRNAGRDLPASKLD